MKIPVDVVDLHSFVVDTTCFETATRLYVRTGMTIMEIMFAVVLSNVQRRRVSIMM